jgi:hypothetical protein
MHLYDMVRRENKIVTEVRNKTTGLTIKVGRIYHGRYNVEVTLNILIINVPKNRID